MFKELAQVWVYRELLLNLVARDIKVRYKNSVLGFLWSFIIPLAQVATLTVVFKYIMRMTIPNYSAYLLCAIIPFNFFQQSILESTTSILTHAGLVKKTYFPREILVTAIVISNFIHFVFGMIVFIFYLLFLRLLTHSGTPPIMMTWLLLPVVMAITSVLTLGVSLILAALNTFYEDVKYLTGVLMGMIFYALPIIYPFEVALEQHKFGPKLTMLIHTYFCMNPLCYLITAYRKIMLPPLNVPMMGVSIHDIPLNYGYLGIAALSSFIIFIIGYAYFNSRKWYFAERL